jgi:alcohol dehydrogenase class IV
MDSTLTAHTGMDALSHAFEAYVSNASSSFTNLYALEAIRLLNENLFKNIIEPNNLQSRGNVMLASLYAGLAFSNASLGITHSMAHSLGGYLDLPHGECNSILLPHVVDYNFESAREQYTAIANVMKLEVGGLTPPQVKRKLMQAIFDLKKQLNIISTLSDKGVTSDMSPVLSSKAIKDPCNATNPRVPAEADLKIIYNEAL